MRTAVLVCLALSLAAALAPRSAGAAGDKLKLGSFGPGKASGPLLSRAELRECFRLLERVRSVSDTMAQERERIEKDKAELQRQGGELKAQLETLDRTSPEAVEAHNARAAAHDKAIGEFESRTGEFNGRVEALKGDRGSFAQRCENRRFDELDETAVKAGK